jgi:hypothetical protein
MAIDRRDIAAIEDPQAQLEQSFIDEYLRLRGHDPATLALLPIPQRMDLMKQAAAWASGKLAEVDARAGFVHQMHGGLDDAHKPGNR